jgi:hypothetical protein
MWIDLVHELQKYLRRKEGRKGFCCKVDQWRLLELGLRFVLTIPVPRDQAFEATAIEEYLIGRLNPLINRIGNSGH